MTPNPLSQVLGESLEQNQSCGLQSPACHHSAASRGRYHEGANPFQLGEQHPSDASVFRGLVLTSVPPRFARLPRELSARVGGPHSRPHSTWAAPLPCSPVNSWHLLSLGGFLGSGPPFVAITRASSVLGTLLGESVHAKVVVLTSDRPLGEEVPQNDPGGSTGAPAQGVAHSLLSGCYLCACGHEIQSPVSTKRTGLGPGRVCSHVPTPS